MGIPTLISTSTASNASSVSITSGIDSTYDEYMFVFTDINAATDQAIFQFQVNATDGADYNDSAITSTYFRAYHKENDSDAALTYLTGGDQAQGTAFQNITQGLGNEADSCVAGVMHLFNPSNTTYVKHFYGSFVCNGQADQAQHAFVAGYFNVTGAIDDIQFKMSSGNMDAVIKMYGVG